MRAADLVPRRVSRPPEECTLVFGYKDADRMRPDGTTEPGAALNVVQTAGSGWRWLGRVWRWRDYPA